MERSKDFELFVEGLKKQERTNADKDEYKKAVKEMYLSVKRMLVEKGELAETSVGVGSGSGRIGMHIENVSFQRISGIEMRLGDTKAIVSVEEVHTGRRNFDKVVVNATFIESSATDTQDAVYSLLTLEPYDLKFLDRKASSEELDVAQNFIRAIDVLVPERETAVRS